MKLTNEILDTLKQMYIREDGIISAEIEYILMLCLNDTNKVNEILNSWNIEEK